MNIRNIRQLKDFARERLENAGQAGRILLIYVGATLGLGMLVTVVNYLLGMQMDRFGGLSNMGTRTFLSTVQTVLPLVQSAVNLCLSVGFLAVVLRIARGQYVSEQTLRLGFDRFWVLLRSTLIQSMLYTANAFLAVYLGILIFTMTPAWNAAAELLAPYLSGASVLNGAVEMGPEVYAQFSRALVPAYILCGVLAALLCIPVMYSYRMVNYVIIDKPGLGAMAALRESKGMMRGNRAALFKLDVSLWWYYGALALASVVGYGDMLLPMVGVDLPGPTELWYFVFYGLYLAISAGIYWFALYRVETVYALAYDAVKPQEPKQQGVVLGNIFHTIS